MLSSSSCVSFLHMPHREQTHTPVRAPAMCHAMCRVLWRAVCCLLSVNPHPCDSLFPVVSIAGPLVPKEGMGCVCLFPCCTPGHAAHVKTPELFVNIAYILLGLRKQRGKRQLKTVFAKLAKYTNILFLKTLKNPRRLEQKA